MKTWIEALKEFNKGTDMWSIPLKNTSNNAFVKRIMKGTTSVPDKVKLIEKKKPRTSMAMKL
jgi:hypothetical protein